MKLLRRILITVVITLVVIFVGVRWGVPVKRSFYAAWNAPRVARVVPVELKDKSVSDAPGKKLSYFGYEFEVPWSDLDEVQTKLSPKDKPEQNGVDLRFHSGLRLSVTVTPPRQWANAATEIKLSPQDIESVYGQEALRSDYSFVKAIYEFTPDKMHHWTQSQATQYREEQLLGSKSVVPFKSAETGIFNVQNPSFKGFQQGNPQVRQDGIAVTLYADEASVRFVFHQKDYQNFAGVTQPEINRIVQSLHRAPQGESASPRVAQKLQPRTGN